MNIILATLLACTTTDDTAAYAPYAGDTGLVTAAPYLYEWATWYCDAPVACNAGLPAMETECVFLFGQQAWENYVETNGQNGVCINATVARECIAWFSDNPIGITCDYAVSNDCIPSSILSACAI